MAITCRHSRDLVLLRGDRHGEVGFGRDSTIGPCCSYSLQQNVLSLKKIVVVGLSVLMAVIRELKQTTTTTATQCCQ